MKFKNKHNLQAKKAVATSAKVALPAAVRAPEPSEAKLSKQERRNRNKLLKATTDVSAQPTSNPSNMSVYKRETVYPTAMSEIAGPWDRFLTPSDKTLPQVLSTSYQGFVVSPKKEFKSDFHEDFRTAMEGLDKQGFYQFDVTQPAGLGTKLAKTFVTRCLVGDAGTTYKYLGLRMFSIPWNADSGASTGTDGDRTSKHSQQIGRLNQQLIRHTEGLLRKSGKDKVGSCQYNLTLINKCFPQDKIALKNEPSFEQDKCTVSWHADSTLEHFSTIGVYHCTSATDPALSTTTPDSDGARATSSTEEDASWRVALRVWYDAEGPNAARALSSRAGEMAGARIAPAVAVPLPSGAAYFLLDDFNHHHQHAVLAGQTYRYASTHRVCKTEGHTYQSVRAKCARLLQVAAGSKQQFLGRNVRAELLAQSELEFEWLRQFYVQGQHHSALHVWWQEPMRDLLKLWSDFQDRLVVTLETLKSAATFDYSSEHGVVQKGDASAAGGEGDGAEKRRERKRWWKLLHRFECLDASCYDAVAQALRERHEKRAGWATREKDALFATLGRARAPLPCPIVESLCSGPAGATGATTSQLPRVTSLLNMAQCVEQWKKGFEQSAVARAAVVSVHA